MNSQSAGSEFETLIVDRPRDRVLRVTLNRPEKRNALNNTLRTELFQALQAADVDPTVHVMILRGAGSCFSAGYEMAQSSAGGTLVPPYYTAPGIGYWSRHVVEGCFRIWDLAKPVIAQVHGFCLAGGSELATACDLVYVAEDALIGYPPVRTISPPDNQFFPWMLGMRGAMELMLTGDAISGTTAAALGFANRAAPVEALEQLVLGVAERVAKIPSDIQQINKRAVHRQMEAMGLRAGIRAGTELQALSTQSESARGWAKLVRDVGIKAALTQRDQAFGDYRTKQQEGP